MTLSFMSIKQKYNLYFQKFHFAGDFCRFLFEFPMILADFLLSGPGSAGIINTDPNPGSKNGMDPTGSAGNPKSLDPWSLIHNSK